MAKKQNRQISDLAQGAILAAKKENSVPVFMDDMVLFASVLQSDSKVSAMLSNAAISIEQRYEALKKILGDQMEPLSINVISLLMERGLVNSFKDFHQLLEIEARESANYHLCRAVSAVPMSDQAKKQLIKILEKRLSGTVKLECDVDPTVIGGLAVTCGDWRYLGTVQAKLQQLSRHLVTTN